MSKINSGVRTALEAINKKRLNKINPSDFKKSSKEYKKRMYELKQEAIAELRKENPKIKAVIIRIGQNPNIIEEINSKYYLKQNAKGKIKYTTHLKNANVNAKRTIRYIELKNSTGKNFPLNLLEKLLQGEKYISRGFEYGIYGTSGKYELRKTQIKF